MAPLQSQIDAGVFNPADQTTDGYNYVCPSYAAPCATTAVPDWQVHFTTTAGQQAQGPFVALSVGLADTESNLTVSLNGNSLAWPALGSRMPMPMYAADSQGHTNGSYSNGTRVSWLLPEKTT